MKHPSILAVALLLLAQAVSTAAAGNPDRPNIIIILADDLGWGDVGFNGCREIPTPNLDRLARLGVRFTSGYASHPYCSPSRAGLLTGRHQQRFGHECNPNQEMRADGSVPDGLPLTETLLPQLLKRHGYRTAAIGKWHLGDEPAYWPSRRGFDFWYGFSGGGFSYWGDVNPRRPAACVMRDEKPVPKSELTHLTDDFSREAADFISRSRTEPFFLYLAYNAPHTPDQATRAHLRRTEHIEQGPRAVYGAMVAAMDDGIGLVLRRLDELRLRERTLVIFYSDNGGRELAVNFPYRGGKGMLFEGGIRVPFCAAWPERIPSGQTFDAPITGLDVFPTVLAAAGLPRPQSPALDGIDLLPHIAGGRRPIPPRTLVWRYATAKDEFGYAVRDGAYKLVSSLYKGRRLLFNLDADPHEHRDIIAEHPDIARRLEARYADWAREMMPPRWLDPHGVNVRKAESERAAAIEKASRGERVR